MLERNPHSAQRSFVGKLIQQDRENAGLSLSQYAATVAVSRPYLSRLERGAYTRPSPDVLTRISEARPILLADLFLASGYLFPRDLPSLVPYLRAIYPDWPEQAYEELTGYCHYLENKHKKR
jgi:transcriptional regulator with XRE-family HTH domain